MSRLLIILMLLPAIVWGATPVITEVEGIVTTGEDLVIRGSLFGTNSTPRTMDVGRSKPFVLFGPI